MDLDSLTATKTLDEATLQFRNLTKSLGVRDVVYGYMLEARGYVRQDVCFSVTISDDLMSLYEAAGGLSTDPVGASLAEQPRYFKMDLQEAIKETSGNLLAQRNYLTALLDAGYRSIWSFPVRDVEPIGYGAMTLFQDERVGATRIDPDRLAPLVSKFHIVVKKIGLFSGLFALHESELSALRLSASGKAAEDIAAINNVSTRTIENRLGKAREKLRARNTTEAVFKASAYGILRDHP